MEKQPALKPEQQLLNKNVKQAFLNRKGVLRRVGHWRMRVIRQKNTHTLIHSDEKLL